MIYHIVQSIWLQEEETEIEIIEYTTTTSSKKEVIESKTPIISGQVVELGSRTKQSEVSSNCWKV